MTITFNIKNKIFRYNKQSINFLFNELRREGHTFWLTYLMSIVNTATITAERMLEFSIFTAGGRCNVGREIKSISISS